MSPVDQMKLLFKEQKEYRLAKYTDFALNEFMFVIKETLLSKKWGAPEENKRSISRVHQARKKHIAYRSTTYKVYKDFIADLDEVLEGERDEGEARARDAITVAWSKLLQDPWVFRPSFRLPSAWQQMEAGGMVVEDSGPSPYDNPVPGPSGLQNKQPAAALDGLFKAPAAVIRRAHVEHAWDVSSLTRRAAIKRDHSLINDEAQCEEDSVVSTFDTSGLQEEWEKIVLR